MLLVHKINLEPFSASRLRVKRLIRKESIFLQNKTISRGAIMEKVIKKERKIPENINNKISF